MWCSQCNQSVRGHGGEDTMSLRWQVDIPSHLSWCQVSPGNDCKTQLHLTNVTVWQNVNLRTEEAFFWCGEINISTVFFWGGWDWEYKTEVTEDRTLNWGQDGLVSRWGPLKHKMPPRGCYFILQIHPKCPSVALCLQYENLSHSDPYPYFC